MGVVGIDMTGFTKTERRIVDLLMDGQIHGIPEILSACLDSCSDACNLRPHISSVRKKLDNRGLLITFVSANGRRTNSKGYQMSRRLLRE